MLHLIVLGLALTPRTTALPAWDFQSSSDAKAWVANSHLSDVAVTGGSLHAVATGRDPFFVCRGLSIPADPWQYVVVRIKADRPGRGQLFWSGAVEGKYGGLSEAKSTRFDIRGDGVWQEIRILPFWHAEGTIRQLRLDVYEGASFEIDKIEVRKRVPGAVQTDVFSWDLKGGLEAWQVAPGVPDLFAPPLRLDVSEKDWVTVQLRATADGVVAVQWSGAKGTGLRRRPFAVRGDGRVRWYNLDLLGAEDWGGEIVAFGLRLPTEGREKFHIESIRIADHPSGPPEINVPYFGFENGVNRAGRPSRVLARFMNQGGSAADALRARLILPDGLSLTGGPAERRVPVVDHGEYEDLTWEVVARQPGAYVLSIGLDGAGESEPPRTTLRFLPPLNLPKADYVPAPRPIETDVEICAYYFPGWQDDATWDCIRDVAPIRKPLLGYYDESNPECVDWQIKWAAENGIGCYLVDWYWVAGRRSHEHWFQAYRKARYRNHLKVAIMWANHNPPKTHSPEDWRNVTRHWIEDYFPLETYYRIDGKPAVFIWAPHNIRRDLGGSDAAKKALDASQAMARAAGFGGITFVAMNNDFSAGRMALMAKEGYVGVTTYHEWGVSPPANKRMVFETVAAHSREAWERKNQAAGSLVYYPVVDTGWDSRPWHGQRGLIIRGRTPALFESLLRDVKVFCQQHHNRPFILAPLNEWGEGSYIEPNTEFGFAMMEKLRTVFGKGDPTSWPVNVAPADVGLGPYDYPSTPRTSDWSFDQDAGGWSAMMNVAGFRQERGALRMRTTSHDPAIWGRVRQIRTRQYPRAVVEMRLIGNVPPGSVGQLFWSPGRTPWRPAIRAAASVTFPLATDGKLHRYELDLAGNRRWRGRIATLRLDPCQTKDIEVVIERFRLLPNERRGFEN